MNTGMSPANVDNVFRSIAALVRNSFASALQSFLAGSAALPIANGGTAATDATTALSNLGGLSSVYRDLPITAKTGSFAFANSERANGLTLNSASPATATINPNETTAINVGAVYRLYNTGSASWTVARGSGVFLSKNGSTSSADAVMAPGARATLQQWGADVWSIDGDVS